MTGVSAADDGNSYWRVRGRTAAVCQRGTPVRCGQAIRLTHLGTGRNLHSHRFTSPLSGNQVPPGHHRPRAPGSVSFPGRDGACLVTRVTQSLLGCPCLCPSLLGSPRPPCYCQPHLIAQSISWLFLTRSCICLPAFPNSWPHVCPPMSPPVPTCSPVQTGSLLKAGCPYQHCLVPWSQLGLC